MSYKARYDKGDWKTICDACGRIFKASLLRKRWDGIMVCPEDWETRQPQDFVRGIADTQVPQWVRPEATDTFTAVGNIGLSSAIADVAIAGYAITDTTTPSWYMTVPAGTFTP